MRLSVRTARPVVPTCWWTAWKTMSSGLAAPFPMAGRFRGSSGPVPPAGATAVGRAMASCVLAP
eukprot:5936013-Lingulodinium_polyedra.AAC.1